MTISPSANQLAQHTYGPGEVFLPIIVECLYPEAQINLYPNEQYEMQSEIAKFASAVREYCEPFLKGDFTSWTRIQECNERRKRHKVDHT